MVRTANRLADRVLERLMPRGEASACSEYLSRCYCVNRIVYYRRCGGGCNGIPHYCYQCVAFGGC
jgi:hypothetical protein